MKGVEVVLRVERGLEPDVLGRASAPPLQRRACLRHKLHHRATGLSITDVPDGGGPPLVANLALVQIIPI